jgi:hypothetical protein
MPIGFKKLFFMLLLGASVSLGYSDDAGHWSGGYVQGHPDAFHRHQNLFTRNWYYPNRHLVRCHYVKPCRHCHIVRRCYHMRGY